MLHHATIKLKRTGLTRQMPDNEIDLHKDEFTHLYTIKGEEITSLTDITPDVKVLVCSQCKHFKGIINSHRLLSFQQHKQLRSKNIQNHLFHKTHKWIREKMLNWNYCNEKVDEKNKMIEVSVFNTSNPYQ